MWIGTIMVDFYRSDRFVLIVKNNTECFVCSQAKTGSYRQISSQIKEKQFEQSVSGPKNGQALIGFCYSYDLVVIFHLLLSTISTLDKSQEQPTHLLRMGIWFQVANIDNDRFAVVQWTKYNYMDLVN